jgi:hypothetical protein
MKSTFLIVLLLMYLMLFAKPNLWVDSEAKIGALFPSDPEITNASTDIASGYSYSCVKSFDEGFALYGITLVPIQSNTEVDDKKLIAESNNSYIYSMGVEYDNANVKWDELNNGQQKLKFSFVYDYQNINLNANGFWIIHNNYIIRVYVTYSDNLKENQIQEILSFLSSFVIVDY